MPTSTSVSTTDPANSFWHNREAPRAILVSSILAPSDTPGNSPFNTCCTTGMREPPPNISNSFTSFMSVPSVTVLTIVLCTIAVRCCTYTSYSADVTVKFTSPLDSDRFSIVAWAVGIVDRSFFIRSQPSINRISRFDPFLTVSALISLDPLYLSPTVRSSCL